MKLYGIIPSTGIWRNSGAKETCGAMQKLCDAPHTAKI